MGVMYLIPMFVFLLSGSSGAAECGIGWTPFKDELCVKLFTNLQTHEEASHFCSSQGNEMSKSSLVMVKEADMQDVLANYTHDIYDYVWLGGQYDEVAGLYKWDDGESLTYTNWQEGYPRNSTDSGCIELRPVNAKDTIMADGKWADVNCQKRNLVMCQRVRSWTLEDTVMEIIRIRKEVVDAEHDRNSLRQMLDATQEELADATNERIDLRRDLTTAQLELAEATTERNGLRRDLSTIQEQLVAMSSKVVPVGSIYIEYYNQPSPQSLWPSLTWQDISSTYAGMFFRVSGGNSSSWGSTQNECAPRISQIHGGYSPSATPVIIQVPSSGWSEFVRAGYNDNVQDMYDILRVYSESCEIRPRNQAVRVWKRTA